MHDPTDTPGPDGSRLTATVRSTLDQAQADAIRLYADFIDHAVACTVCETSDRLCPDARQLRAAWMDAREKAARR